jgi:uncharacterized phage protein (predicted DNA packaging)
MAYQLVELETVKTALRVDHDDDDAMLLLYIKAASQTLIGYLKSAAEDLIDLDAVSGSPADTDDVPQDIALATIVLVGHFYREVDGDSEKAFDVDGAANLPRAVVALLRHLRDPALA